MQKFVLAVNSITTQFWAMLVLWTGCAMIVYTKKYGIDATIAGGIIGVAANMLTTGSRPELKTRTTDANSQTTTLATTVP